MSRSLRRWDALAEEKQFTQLDEVRSAAEQWRNGIGALTGALATASLLKGAESYADLSGDVRRAAVGLSALALVLLVLGTGLAMRAAFKRPRSAVNTAENLRAFVTTEARHAAGFLRASKVTVALALGCLLPVLVLSWTAEEPEVATWAVTLANGVEVCGELVGVDDEAVTVKGDDQVRRLPWAEVAEVKARACSG